MRIILDQLLNGQPLTEAQTTEAFTRIFQGQADDAQIASLLSLIQARQATVDELVGAARVMRQHAQIVPTHDLPAGARVLDTCGTGGAPKTFNISTVAAFIVAGAGRDKGVYVAKHGNRSRSGRGSAEALQTLGVNINATPTVQARCLKEVGVCFSYAIRHHPAAKHAASVRQSLGFPTIFNLLGPLTNPAGAPRQLLGVYDQSRVEPMAMALARLGADRAMVVHGLDGMDEISTTSDTFIAQVHHGVVTTSTFDARDLGVASTTLDALKARDLAHAADIMKNILSGKRDDELAPMRDIAIVNAAGAMVVTDAADDWQEGLAQATAAIDSGAAMTALTDLARVSNEP